MKTKKTSSEKKGIPENQSPFSLWKLLENGWNDWDFLYRWSNAVNRCSTLRRKMGRGQGAEVKETKETQEQPEGGGIK